MRKIFLLSFDDGTVWDKRFVQLLNNGFYIFKWLPC